MKAAHPTHDMALALLVALARLCTTAQIDRCTIARRSTLEGLAFSHCVFEPSLWSWLTMMSPAVSVGVTRCLAEQGCAMLSANVAQYRTPLATCHYLRVACFYSITDFIVCVESAALIA